MSATDKLPKDFISQFKSLEDFQLFFNDLFKQGVEKMLEAGRDDFLGYEKYSREGYNSRNSRNGTFSKTVKTDNLGDMVLNIPRDRNGEFEPRLIPKGQRMSDKLEEAIIGMYSRGMTCSDIRAQVKEIYGVDVSEGTVSNITNRLVEHIMEWQDRPLETVYFILWMDGISIRVRHNGKYINKCMYIVMGLKKDGHKEILGMWIAESESAAFWLSVLTDLKARGVQDILIACTDNLAGFTQAIRGVFPQAVTQLCIVHQVRNSCKVRGVEGRQRVLCRPQADIHGHQCPDGRKSTGGHGSKMGNKIQIRHPVMEQQLGKPQPVFLVPTGDQADHVHHQYHRKPEPRHTKVYPGKSAVYR